MVALIEKLFGTKIRPAERPLVAMLTLNLFVLLTAYYVLKVVREPLILLEGGVVSRNAARGAQAAILLLAVPAYGLLANRVQPRKLVTGVLAFFFVTLLSFPLLAWLGVPVGFAFFVWLGIFSITAIAQFWSLTADLFTEEAGRRLFAVIAAGGTVGAVAGAQLVLLLKSRLGPMALIAVAAGVLALCLVITRAVLHRGEQYAPVAPHPVSASEADGDKRGGFTLVLQDRYLLLIAVSVLLLNLVNSTGDQVMAMIVQEHARGLADEAARRQFLLGYYANFQTWISIATAAMQVLAVARLVRLAGVQAALAALPVIALAGYGALAVAPILLLATVVKVVENSADYSVQNTVQQMLFLPTSRAAKYKAKAATDTFFVRFGDLGSWAVVSAAIAYGWSATTLSIVNACVALAWIGVALQLASRYRRLRPVDSPVVAPAQLVAARANG